MGFLTNSGGERLWAHIVSLVGNKVDRVPGKDLSTNDYTTAEKEKLANIEEGATKITVDTNLSALSTNPVQNSAVHAAIKNLNTLVGDTAVSVQIFTAVTEVKDYTDKQISSHEYSWNDLEDRPFGEEKVILFESSYTNLDTIEFSNTSFAKLLNEPISRDAIVNENVFYNMYENGRPGSNYYFGIESQSADYIIDNKRCLVSVYNDCDIEGVSFTRGVWGRWANEYYHVGLIEEKYKKQIDDSYIPDTIARVKDIPEGFSGSWKDLKDKPFYSERVDYINGSTLFECFDKVTVPYDRFYCDSSKDFEVRKLLIEGQEYTVAYQNVDGFYEEKTYIAQDVDGNIAIGNLSFYDDSYPNTGEPFIIFYLINHEWAFVGTKEPGQVQIFEFITTNIKTLDESVIPNTIARVKDIPEHTWESLPDKPFYKTIENIELLNDDNVYMIDQGYNYSFRTNGTSLEIGQEYIVVINGQEYNCIVKENPETGELYCGNGTVRHSEGREPFGEDTGEPFVFAHRRGSTTIIEIDFVKTLPTPSSVIVRTQQIQIQHISDEFISNNIARVSDVEAIDTKIGDKSIPEQIDDAIAQAKINEKLEKIDTLIDTENRLANEIAVERGRINQFTTLEAGSTTGDAELQDIRVDWQGTQYENAGTAVRAQTKNLYQAITNNIYTITPGEFSSCYVTDNVGGIKSFSYTHNGKTPEYSGVGVDIGKTASQLTGKKVILIFHENKNAGDVVEIGDKKSQWAGAKSMRKVSSNFYEYIFTGSEGFGEGNLYFHIQTPPALSCSAKFSLYIADAKEEGINVAHRAFYADNVPVPKLVDSAFNAGVLIPDNNLLYVHHQNTTGSATYNNGKFSINVNSASTAKGYYMVASLDVTDIIKYARYIDIKTDGCVNELHLSTHQRAWGSYAIKNLVIGMNDLTSIDWSQYADKKVYLQCGSYEPANLPRTGNMWFTIRSEGTVIADRFEGQENYPTFADLNAPGNYITCWGDSLTAQGGWTSRLAELSDRPVYNAGTGGETARTIMARQGGDVMMINNITIPADTTPIQIGTYSNPIKTAFGHNATPLLQGGGAHVNPVNIAGILGNLTWTGSSYSDTTGIWTFTRLENGESVTINRPTAIVTAYDREKNNPHLMVIFMGQNGGFNSNEELVNLHRLMIDHASTKHTIVLGLSSGTASERAEYETAMRTAFGRYFISLREYLSTYGLEDAGLTPTAEDNAAMSSGKVPPQLLADSVHYTNTCKTVIGNMLYKKCCELGIF